MMFEIPALHREFAVAFVQTVQGLDRWLLAEATARIDFSDDGNEIAWKNMLSLPA
jgi:hypothetical protein